MRALVVNGDDFGLTPGVNAGILDAHLRGILTSASLFANAPATPEAIAIARRTPALGVGCHLALVDGEPALPPRDVPTLAPGGRFRPTWIAFIRDAAARRIRPIEIERELTAQIERVVAAGIQPTHVDSHKHVHAYPPVFAIVARLARRYGVNAVRVPYEAPALRLLARHADLAGARRQALENLALAPWCARDRRLLEASGLPPAPMFLGRVLTGLFTRASLAALLHSIAEGTSELMMHPGYADAALDGVRTRLRAQRAAEVDLLIDPAAQALVAGARIVLLRHDRRPSAVHEERPCLTPRSA